MSNATATPIDFSIHLGGDAITPNHEIIWDITDATPDDVCRAIGYAMNDFVDDLKALRVKDAPESNKVQMLEAALRSAAWQKTPAHIGLKQITVKIGYADTGAVESYLAGVDGADK